ncbi:MAG: ABC transporter substrate-binding protein [Acidobacteriaceae bacterium]|nr:ABC transporter substrate-binding protein [Acidobacteriaceae bacterium]MBV9781292.1 ABC transporter substrate-binding protein [Acidobacteriaceae bacterium]
MRAIFILFCVACLSSCSRQGAVVIGSKNFTEQVILGEMAAQQLERKLHIPIERRLNLGGTLLAHEALVHSQIDLYPEYTGTASSVILKQKPGEDPAKVYMEVKDAYRERFHLTWLPPLGFNDTFAMVVRREDGQRLSRPELSSALSRSWRLGVFYEFLTRPDGLRKLNDVYSLHWQGTPKSMDLGLLYQALAKKQIDMAAADSTDAPLSGPNYIVLADDKKAFPPYNACFVVRENLLQNAGIKWALTMLSGRISEETMRGLNRRVDIDHQPVQRVVSEFLAKEP